MKKDIEHLIHNGFEMAKIIGQLTDKVIALEEEVKELKKGEYFKHLEELKYLEN